MLQEEQTLRRKRQQFHCSIRRSKKNDFFRQQRSILMEYLIHTQQQEMKSILDTVQKKQQWVHARALELVGIPTSMWRIYIDNLSKAYLCFNSNFNQWIQQGIIISLCTLFYDDNLSLNLGSSVAKLLSALIYHQNQTQTQKTSYIAEQILNQDILQNICSIAQNPHQPQEQKIQFMILLTNLALTNNKLVIRSGALKVFIDWTYQLMKANNISKQNLNIIYQFYYCMVLKKDNESINYNVAFSILKVLDQLSQIKQTDDLKRMLMVIVQKILKKQTQAMFSTMFENRRLLKFIFQQAIHHKQSIRLVSWNILSLLSASSRRHNFYDAVTTAYSYDVINSDNCDNITISLLICVGNIASEEEYNKQKIIKFKIIDIVIDSIHPERSTKLREDGYYCLCQIVKVEQYEMYTRIIADYPIILERIALGLETMGSKIVYEIALALLTLIHKENTIYRQEGNLIFSILETKFDLQKLLDETEIKYSKNAKILEVLDKIRDIQGFVI